VAGTLSRLRRTNDHDRCDRPLCAPTAGHTRACWVQTPPLFASHSFWNSFADVATPYVMPATPTSCADLAADARACVTSASDSMRVAGDRAPAALAFFSAIAIV
jgi:hypothetical protein